MLNTGNAAQGRPCVALLLCYSDQELKPKSNSAAPFPILIAAAVIALVCLLQALRACTEFDVLQRLEWMTY